MTKRCIFDAPHIKNIAKIRLAHLESLGLPLEGKRVLEVGSGIGRLTHWFEARNCDIISTDGNAVNVVDNLRRHPWRKGRVFVADLEQTGSHDWLGTFDVVLCWGCLYHLGKPARCIVDMAAVCTDLFLLETKVNPVDNGGTNIRPERPGRDKALHGRRSMPARDWIMGRLRGTFAYAYLTRQQPNHPFFPLKWPGPAHSRAVFVGSYEPLELPSLSDTLLNEQTRYVASDEAGGTNG